MGGWQLFGYWLILFFGFLWVKRSTGLLRCNVFSAAIASVIFLAITAVFGAFAPYVLEASGAILVAYFLFMALLIIPVTFYLTLRLGNWFIPFFKVNTADLRLCTIRLSVWTFVGLLLLSLIKYAAFLLLAGASSAGMPRLRTFDGRYYY